MKPPPFLAAEWRHLALVNYEIDPAVLRPRVPAGTELDDFAGRCFASLVGFRFRRTRVLGIAVPFHRNFDEVNLRFYVRRKAGNQWRRGVVFVRELVPRRAIAWVARNLYGEPYLAVPMRHEITEHPLHRVRYEWKFAGAWNRLEATATSPWQPIADGSIEEFIAEHYWGYTARARGTAEYEVVHPCWRIQSAESRLEAEVARLYGAAFREALSARPASAFLAEGSAVEVRLGGKIA